MVTKRIEHGVRDIADRDIIPLTTLVVLEDILDAGVLHAHERLRWQAELLVDFLRRELVEDGSGG